MAIKGLAAIRKQAESTGGGGRFLRLKDGDSVKIRFLQELDEESDLYNEEAGLGFIELEYEDPDDFKKKAVDTTESEGKCWMAEQGWRPKARLYINVLDVESGEPRIFSFGLGKTSPVNALLESAEEFGNITGAPFRLKRKGAGKNDTVYTLTRLAEDKEPFDPTSVELIDLDKVLNHLPYDKQEEFFRGSETEAESDSSDW